MSRIPINWLCARHRFGLRRVILVTLLGLSGGPTVPAAEQLRGESSALLRVSVASPVDWMPWGEAAFARAKQAQKPVYLFIGSFNHGLSRAMREQTFAQPEIAKMLNANFVCVLVDQEEHPELAALYRTYLSGVKQLTGLPMNLWLTPELLPFDGATYLPPSEEWGKTSFSKLANQVQQAWTTDPAACRQRAGEAVAQLLADRALGSGAPGAGDKIPERLKTAAETWRAQFDAAHGDFGEAPKTPEPELLRFLLRQSPPDRAAALKTLRSIATGALRDPLDGGFFQSASDAAWRVPHPQKTLALQARLALAWLDAAHGEDAVAFAGAACGALDFALNRLVRPDGTFAAGQDATADGFANYYTWTEAEIDRVLGADAAMFKLAHGVEAAGNVPADFDLSGQFKGQNLLRSALLATAEDRAAAARLLVVRERRPAPPVDDRATAGTHGLLLAALSRAGAQLDEPRYRAAAARLFATIKKEFQITPAGDLRRLVTTAIPAAPADYAAVALGCREFARAAHQPEAEALADRLLAIAGSRLLDPIAGRYYATTAALSPGIFLRPLASGDMPSPESLALQAGVPPEQALVIASSLSALLSEAGDTPPGDVLLALALRR